MEKKQYEFAWGKLFTQKLTGNIGPTRLHYIWDQHDTDNLSWRNTTLIERHSKILLLLTTMF
jgi:hypothetical protein